MPNNRLIKFHSIAKNTFYLHLKECEWRFNLRNNNLYDILIKEFGERTLK
jgi:transposase